MIPKKDWTDLSQRTIWHGRRICHARKPACGACALAPDCPSYGPGPVDPEVAAKLVKTGAQVAARGDPAGAGGRRVAVLAAGLRRSLRRCPGDAAVAGRQPSRAWPACSAPRARRPPRRPRCPTCRCPAWARPRARRRRAAAPAHRPADGGQPVGQLVRAVPRGAAGARPAAPGPPATGCGCSGWPARTCRRTAVAFAADNRLPFASPAGPGRRPARAGCAAPGCRSPSCRAPDGTVAYVYQGAAAHRRDPARAGPGQARRRCR